MNTIRQRIEKLIEENEFWSPNWSNSTLTDQIISTILESLKEKNEDIKAEFDPIKKANQTGYNQAIKDFRKALGEE